MVSSKIIVAKLASDYGVEADAYETNIKIWTFDKLNELQLGNKYKGKFSKTMTIADYYITLPCKEDNIISITYNNVSLTVNDSITNFANGFHLGNLGFCYPSGNRYYFPFETGEVELHYLSYFKDNTGWPCIPDSQLLQDCLCVYSLYRMIMRGYKHQTLSFNDVYSLLNSVTHRASNSLKIMGEREHKLFADMLINLAPDVTLPDNFYLTTDSNYSVTGNDYFLSQIDRI